MIYTADLPQWAENFATVMGIIIAALILISLIVFAFIYLGTEYKKELKRKQIEEKMNKEIYEYYKKQNEEIKKVDNPNG